VCLEVVRSYLRHGWDLSALDIAAIGPCLIARGFEVDAASGRLAPAAIATGCG
jgi:hypothetical protein